MEETNARTVGKARCVRIGVSVEHGRGWGRRICEGIAAFSHTRPDWSLELFEDGLPPPPERGRIDGWLWCVRNARTASALHATGHPAVDLFNDGRYPGLAAIGADHDACGRLAAEHFVSRHFRHFAFFGWRGLHFSNARQVGWEKHLRLRGFASEAILSDGGTLDSFIGRDVLRERLSAPPDAAEVLRRVRRLPEPCAVFCANDLRAWQLADLCRRAGLPVPGRIAILGVDDDPVPCMFSSVPLSSVDTDTFGTGWRAAALLAEILDGGREAAGTVETVAPVGVVTRASTEVYPVNPPWLAETLAWIRSRVSDSLTAAEVARHACRCYSSVETAFRDILGTTVQREIMAARLDAAEELLRAGRLSVEEISIKTGFGSPQYFNRCFHRRHGVAPGAWRGKNNPGLSKNLRI